MTDAPDTRTRGVQNPYVVDRIELDAEHDQVVLVMLESRAWGGAAHRAELEAKLNSYLAYVQTRGLARDYPGYAGKTVRFQVECAVEPDEETLHFLESAADHCEQEGIAFEVRLLAPEALAER